MTEELFVLHPGFVATPIAGLPVGLRSALSADPSSVAVSVRGVRAPSILLGADAAKFIEKFQRPATIIEALIGYASDHCVDPYSILEDTAALVLRLQLAKVLISPEAAQLWGTPGPSLRPRDQVGDWRVVRCIQAFADSEVYVVERLGGVFGLLKLEGVHAAQEDRTRLLAEAELVAALNAPSVPCLLDSITNDARFGFVLDWIEGGDVAQIAARMREAKQWTALEELAIGIAETYAILHSKGIVHGDVHPSNVLVDKRGSIRLIDFGQALRISDGAGPAVFGRRAAVSQYLEPEAVENRVAGRHTLPTELGEQFSVAALIYTLLTGAAHLEWLVEAESWCRRVTTEVPLPFPSRELTHSTALEAVVRAALSANPKQRFRSMADFAHALRSATVTTIRFDPAPSSISAPQAREVPAFADLGSASETLLDFSYTFIDRHLRFRTGGLSLPTVAPLSSIYHGGAGIALACLRFALLMDDPELLASADVYATLASRACEKGDGQWFSAINPGTVDAVSLFHGPAGIQLAVALTADALGDTRLRRLAVRRFISISAGPARSSDLTMGRAGSLLGAAVLLRSLDSSDVDQRTALLAAGHEAQDDLWARLTGMTVGGDDQLHWLGMAHGWAGVLFALLEWHHSSQTVPPQDLASRLDELSSMAEPKGSGLQWHRGGKKSPGAPPVPGWCHGAAGYVHLWLSASRLYDEPRYLALARGAAWETYLSAAIDCPDLCCGYAGRSWALLELARASRDTMWGDRARKLAERAVREAWTSDRPKSLFKGHLGIALLAAEVARPEIAITPLGCGWRP